MRFGVVILPEHPWSQAAAIWRRAEELGFDDAWTYDHIAWGALRDQPWFGAVPTLAAVAAVTQRLRLGTLVASPNFRHPVPFARDLLAVDDISGGRFTLGIGAGGTGWDATVLGQQPWSPAERADRFEEFVELTDRLLRATIGRVRYDGRFYSAHEAPMRPGCVQTPRIPFAVAAVGPRSMRLAATFGEAWVTTGDRFYDQPPLDVEQSAALLRQQVDRLEQACAAVGREAATIDRIALTGLRLASGLSSPEAFHDLVGRYEDAGITSVCVHWPRRSDPFAGNVSAFERIFGG